MTGDQLKTAAEYLALLNAERAKVVHRLDAEADGTYVALAVAKEYGVYGESETALRLLQISMEMAVSCYRTDEEAARWLRGFVGASEIIDRCRCEAYGEHAVSVSQREMLALDPDTIVVCATFVETGGPEEVRGGVAQELRFLAALVMDAQAEARGAF